MDRSIVSSTEFPVTAASEKPLVLTLASYYLPGFKSGGPLRSIYNLTEVLADDFRFAIVTRDRDLGESASYRGIPQDAWIEREAVLANYRSSGGTSFRQMARLLRETPHDVLYINSIFDIAFSTWPLLARRLRLAPSRALVIAPRGEFGPGALALNGAVKNCYLRTARTLNLFQGALWMASSEREARDIQRVLKIGSEQISIASDIVDAAPLDLPDPPARAAGEPLRLIFLARITPMKNLEYVFELLAGLGDLPVTLDIVGPCPDAEYLSALRSQADGLPPAITVNFVGEVHPDQTRAFLSRYDLMLLPTRGENFGHVIFEALQAGTPVLISDQTPWRTTPDQACVTVPLAEPDQFRHIIRQRAHATSQEQQRLRRAARRCAETFGSDPSNIAANRALFRRAAATGVVSDTSCNHPSGRRCLGD